MHAFLKDCRYSVRSLLARPAFALTIVLTLALGIGANTAIFSVLKTVLLDALPFAQPGQLVALAQRNGDADPSPTTVGYATFLDWQKLPAFSAIGVSSSWQPNLAADNGAELLKGQSVTRDFFNVLGVAPQLGRLFSAEEDQPDRNDVVVLSAGLWQRQFNGDPNILGKRIALGSRSYSVIGVLPATFEPLLPATAGRPPDIWRPLGYDLSLPYSCRDCMHLQAIGRLAPGVDMKSAQVQLDVLSPALIKEYADKYPADMRFELHPLRDALVGDVSHSLWLLFAGVGLVLLIACVDIASLMLLRAISRRHELSVRAALGAERARLTRLMLSESMVLGCVGGVVGTVFALAITHVVAQTGPASIPRLRDVHVDLLVLVFALSLTLVVALATGLWPAFRASRPQLSDALKDAGRISSGPTAGRAQTTLVVVQIAIACALTLGALLMARSFARLLDVDPGFATKDIVTLDLAIVGVPYKEPAKVTAFLDLLEARIRELSGVARVGAVSQLPLGGGMDRAGFHIKDRLIADPEAPSFDRTFVTAGYFPALQIPLISGRYFSESDRLGQLPVAVVSESLARLEWPGESALGKQIQLGGRDDNAPWFTIVGVVGDVRLRSLDIEASPQAYLADAQSDDPPSYMTLAVHTALPAATLLQEARAAARSIDPGVPIYAVKSMQERATDSLARRQFLLRLFGLFAATGLLLSAIGIYGVVAHAVEREMRVFGLRRALGASDGALIAWVSSRSARYLFAGLALGLPLAFAWASFLSRELYGVSAADPLSYALLVAALIAVVAIATLAPLRRALRVDPMVALRHE
ncbi:MAG: ABC transporter permease [Dokdonella sp.]